MGLYDTFKDVCPKCAQTFYAQTKLTDCVMTTFCVGDRVPLADCRLEVKDGCQCGLHPIVIIHDGIFRETVQDAPTLREGPFGTLLTLGEDRDQAEKTLYSTLIGE